MTVRGKSFYSLLSLASLSSVLALQPATANSGISYTLTLPFERIFEEEKTFKPPLKFSKSDIDTVLRLSCGVYVGKNPEIQVRLASGKGISPIKMRASHKFSSSGWSKNSYGENIYTFRGTCTFVGTIGTNLPLKFLSICYIC